MQKTYVSMSNAVISNNDITTNRMFYDLSSKRKTCNCGLPNCENVVTPDKGVRIATPSHPRGITLCDTHAEMFNNLSFSSYSTENNEHVGTPTAKGLTFSCEIETVKNTPVSIASMVCDLHFYPSHDGSLWNRGIEYKSRIFNSLNSATKTFGTIQALNENGFFDTLDDTCGGHIHTGFYNDPVDFSGLYNTMDEYYKVFKDLFEYLDKMPNAKMHEYFGRGFTNYARVLRPYNGGYVLPCHDGNGRHLRHDDMIVYCNDNPIEVHEIIFNLQHSYSIEFRLPKFINATQYRQCVLAMQDLTDILRRNEFKYSPDLVKVFIKHFPY